MCISDCTGRQCGSDGCGGSCGSCDFDESCSQEGLCESTCGLDYVWVDGLCVQIDDCALTADPCHSHGSCLDDVLSYRCACEGVWGDETCGIQLPLGSPRDIVIDVSHRRALIADSYWASIVAVDLGTGTRSILHKMTPDLAAKLAPLPSGTHPAPLPASYRAR